MSSPAMLHSRACAAVTAASCFAHLGLAAGNHHTAWPNALMLAMVAVCLPCAVHIWQHSRVAALRRVMASALAMTAVHAFVLLTSGRSAHGSGHSHAAPAALGLAESAGSLAEPAGSAGESGAVVLLLVIALEMTTAFLAATLVARMRMRGQTERTLPALPRQARTGR